MTTDNTTHPAPTPAPVAVPEFWVDLPNAKDISDAMGNAHESFDRAYFRADSPDDMRRAVDETREHLISVLAQLPEQPRPEPTADPSDRRCTARATDPITTRHFRPDGWSCGRDVGHSGEHVLYSTDGERVLYAGSWRAPRPEPVVAPLPSEAVEALAEVLAAAEWPDLTWDHIVRWSTPERYRLRARAVLAAGYRLVPEDDEDTVRVALADLVRLKEEPHDDAYRAEKEATWQAVRDALGGRVDEDTVRVPREGLGRLLSTVEREVASILNGDQ